MRRSFAILVALSLTFALLPLVGAVTGGGGGSTATTLVIEPGQGAAVSTEAVAWDVNEFGAGADPLAFRATDGQQSSAGGCVEVPPS
ncbi:hypothetical protein [Tepidiforma sp.]|uniref:hypothetical protein n=1 Tax=Tepidiforma sp. TaxID=2682230 RepID=UPI002ADD8EA1|nr:hypothetical protein [Tepidiforma sp.]